YPAREGYAAFRGYRTRFRVVGTSRAHWPLLCIHGGPAFGYDYLGTLGELLTTGRQVVFYDQLGCGASDSPDLGPAWSLELFLQEIEAVRAAAGLARCHVLGHGWGGILALEYALTHPAGLETLVLSSAVASVPQWRREISRLVELLPKALRDPLQAALKSTDTTGFSDRTLIDAFHRHHLCRMKPWPESLERSVAEARARPAVRLAMLGPNELAPAGQLADWDVVAHLAKIEVPTLVLSGRNDLAPPPMSAALYQGIHASEWVVFEHSAHVPHLEEPQRYLEVLAGFLDRVEGTGCRPA
ncbi:MAG: proline iminopeptidase-family hydrolase, partial [Candidatus Loosdrechtia sp.]|uniref:proline iminopeptidase-family hydrolase n=1 Tax=Candidatus Loosdrechtia sp. TaxID=3101272 RepID=UPI00403ACAB6